MILKKYKSLWILAFAVILITSCASDEWDLPVEEVIPLAKMVELYGPCIAPILPTGEGVERYKTPDSRMEPELWKRHESKIATKTERQVALLAQTGFTLSFLKGGVMEEYR